ncbi:MAG: DUF4340 domain-containing protein [Terriglobia bacterium]
MTRRYLNTLIAIIILVVLWFFFTGWNKHKSRVEQKKEASTAAQKILPLAPSRVQAFTLTSRDGKTFTLERKGQKGQNGESWNIVSPRPIDADQGKVAGFLQSLTGATVAQVVAAHPADLKEFGLDPPGETIRVSANSTPRQFTLLLGDDTPTSTGAYAQVVGDPRVFTLSTDTKTSLEKTLFDLRDTQVVTLDTDQINRIVVNSGKQSYTLVKNPEGVWEVSLPPDVRADHFTVEGLVDSLQSMTMQSIASQEKTDGAKYGLAAPAVTIKLTAPGGSQELLVGKKTSQGYYAMNSALSPIFTLDQDSVSQFQKNASDFRDKNLFSWDMFGVHRFAVTTPKGRWAFEQNKNQWKETAPAAKAASSDNVNAFLSALRGLQASSFPEAKNGDMNQFGFNHSLYTVKVNFGSKNQTETAEVAKEGDKIYARRNADPLPSELTASDLKSVEDAFNKLK